MIPYIGDFAEDATIYHYFNTFDSNDPSSSVTATNLIDSDIFVYKDGSVTDIVTDGATVVIDFDARTGLHKLTIDTSVSADYSTGSDYMVMINGVTVDAGTINAGIFTFSIENRFNAAFDRIGVAGAGLTDLGGMSIGMQAEVQSECNDALVANHLDHLLAVDYDPASKPGTATALLNELVENDAGVSRFTTNALETAPGGTPTSNLLQSTTILAYTSNTVFTLTAGSADDDAYNNQMVIITDQTTGTQKAIGRIANTGGYVGATRTVTLDADPLPGFTFANGDTVDIFAITGDTAVLEVDANGRVDLGSIAGTAQTPGDAIALINTVDAVVDGIQTDLSNGTDGLGAIRSSISTAQADLDIITGVDGVNLLSATQASIDAIETDTSTTLDTKVNTIDTVVDGIQTDLDNATDGLGALKAKLDLIEAAVITNAAGVDIAADIIAIDTIVDTIVAKTNQLNFTVAGDVDANVQAVANAPVSEGGSDPASPIGQT